MDDLKKIKIFCIVGFAFVCVFGSLSHFFYDWSNNNVIIGVLFPANESTWEHLKLAIFPTLLFFLVGAKFIKNENYIFALFITLLTPMIVIPTIFYTYTAIVGSSIIWIDILNYFIAVFISWLFCYLILKHEPFNKYYTIFSLIGIAIILVCYLTFTLNPPKNFLFYDYANNRYGLK